MKGQDLSFRPMLSSDEQAVRELVSEVFKELQKGSSGLSSEGWETLRRYAQPEALLQRKALGCFIELAFVGEELAGLIEMRGADCISLLYVRSKFASQGVGSHLVGRAAARCSQLAPGTRHLRAWVLDEAIPFYEKLGFSRCGARKESGGVASTPFRKSLAFAGRIPATPLHSRKVELFVFSGTGNTLMVARAVSRALEKRSIAVSLRSMEAPCPALPQDTAVGLAFPVAFFSTYPTVLRFIEGLPSGEGREVFLFGTMGGVSFGMQAPLKKELVRKGYRPVAAHLFVMPGNYGNKTMPHERNEARVTKAMEQVEMFVSSMLEGGASFGSGGSLLSFFFYRLAHTRHPWNLFYKLFPFEADVTRCVKCGRCAAICPEKAIVLDPSPQINTQLCQSCQRCVAFCPVSALQVPKKPAEVYRAMPYEDFRRDMLPTSVP
ncbi:MAG: GNAT family N-acetyltransferase [Fretibacterium sp.]|nr:GNAT family N-acetyltransferase [Fretibacterium sp.]